MERMRVCVWAWGFVSLQPSQVGDMVTAAHGSGVVGLARLMSWLGSGASAAVCAWWLAARWPPAGRGGNEPKGVAPSPLPGSFRVFSSWWGCCVPFALRPTSTGGLP